jgi:CheY-like chemotaxis protein/CHASE3 domain sensor protein
MKIDTQALPLMSKITIGFFAIIFILIFAVSVTIWQVHNLNSTVNHLVDLRIPTAQASINLLNGLNRVSAAFRGYLLTTESSFLNEKDAAWQTDVLPNFEKLQQLATSENNKINIDEISTINTALSSYNQWLETAIKTPNQQQALQIFQDKTSNISSKIKTTLKNITNNQNYLMTLEAKQIENDTYRLLTIEWILLTIGIITGIALSLRISRNIARPVLQLTDMTKRVAKGELSDETNVTGPMEIQQLGNSVNNMMNTMKEITNVATSVAAGNYNIKIAPRSEQDKLIHALIHMTDTLKQNKLYYENKTWLQQGINSIVTTISENNELDALCKSILNEVCRYLQAGIGVLYLKKNDGDILDLVSSFSFTEREGLASHFNYGEGVIGQVAVERKPILLKNITRHEIVISTGTTEESPINTYTFPLINKRELIGVIELGFHEVIDKNKLDYIEQITPTLASSIRVAQQQELTEKLLTAQQELTHELQEQQEELKAANEEMEAQTEELRTSEEELRMRDEEQRTLNEELEKQNKILAMQKEELEKTQGNLINKTEEATLASKYKSDFLANMSHELRTPLNSLLLLSRLLSENSQGNLTNEQLESIKVICSSGEELLQLINDILDLAKVESGKITLKTSEIQLYDFVESLERDFKHIAKNKNIEFTSNIDSEVPKAIISDSQRLRQIIKNLLSNAFKFTDKGSIKVRVGRPKKHVVFNNSQLNIDNCIAFSVTDSGKGIQKKHQQLIFQNFYQIDSSSNRKYGGTGLGLSISLQLAKLLGGEIQIESELNKGSTFTLYIPEKTYIDTKDVTLDETETEITTESQQTESSIKNVKTTSTLENVSPSNDEKLLLIVEDDAQFAQILKNVCEKKGFSCLHASDGKSALELVRKNNFSGILMDINLPDISGLDIADQLKQDEVTRHIPIHFISGMDNSEEALRHGAISHIMKPITIEQLNVAIKGISQAVGSQVETLLLVEDDENMRNTICKLFKARQVDVNTASTAYDALKMLKSISYDCMILDLGLPDMSGIDLLETINKDSSYTHPPVIIYTGHELTEEESDLLHQYSDNIIIKGKSSLDRLVDETTLFLHHIIEKDTLLTKKQLPSSRQFDKKHFNGKKVLLVDDDIRNTFALAKVLRAYGIEVLIAPNGQVGLELLGTENNIDAVLMDIMMPVMDGFETIQKIREKPNFSNLPIIALTAKTMPTDKEKCLSVGATDYLPKPLDVEKLLILLRAWV